MIHTLGYQGHYIHLSYFDRQEKVKAQIMRDDGGFHLVSCKTFIGAQRAITNYVRAQEGANK